MKRADAGTAAASRPVVIVGAGGHAKVLLEALRAQGQVIHGLCDAAPEQAGWKFPGETIIGDDRAVLDLPAGNIAIVIGVGGTRVEPRRKELFTLYRDAGFDIMSVIHPSAVVASDAVIGAGTQIMAGAVIQPAVVIGENSVINTRACVDHDCRIGDHVFVAPGVTLCGGVAIGEGAHIGAGAVVLEGRNIGARATIGGGAAVISDVAGGATVVGVPAHAIRD